MKISAINCIDFYKSDHRRQYPANTEYVYSNFTPRTGKYSNAKGDGIIYFGLQGFIKWFLIDCWNDTFFNQPVHSVLSEYQRRMDGALGKGAVTTEHIEALHNLGYLPIKIKSLTEGRFVPYGVPVLTIINTRPEFSWLTNYLESIMSAELWKASTSATIAKAYRTEFERHAELTGSPVDFIDWQGHDFSFRGMGGVFDAMTSGAGHLTSFKGTDTVGAIDYVEEYYHGKDTFVGGSVPASEHSCMCMGTLEDERGTFKRFITEIYPTGVVSIVSDTWDFWKVMTDYLPSLKQDIMERDGRVVIRPDSGDPVDIICGTGKHIDDPHPFLPEELGAYELLWDTFGGTVNEQGYKVLDTHVGLIYGDSITLERQAEILKRLEAKGFCASNLVLGIGSYTYQYCTRDTHGFAMKATWGQVNGEGREIFKDPVTDDGMKKSAKGLLRVDKVDGQYVLSDQVTPEEEKGGELTTVFINGKLLNEVTLEEVRRCTNGLNRAK
ncbi:MAG: nicotinate phosphoribosyltransferase [Planctomycetes bacterium]|nr:nicotinate phosphoribosyltransferase [Planctomycetota bacterium]